MSKTKILHAAAVVCLVIFAIIQAIIGRRNPDYDIALIVVSLCLALSYMWSYLWGRSKDASHRTRLYCLATFFATTATIFLQAYMIPKLDASARWIPSVSLVFPGLVGVVLSYFAAHSTI